MTELYEQEDRKTWAEKLRPGIVPPHKIGFILLLLAWVGLTLTGYWFAKHYVEQTMREIQETNAMNVQGLEKEIKSLRAEMNTIEEALAQTDKTLSTTDSASKAVNERITELDEQLKNLEKSLNILMESGNEDY